MFPGKRQVVACVMLAAAGLSARQQTSPPGVWQRAPEYARLFGAPGARAAAYRAYITPNGLDEVLRQLGSDPQLLRPPGAWTPAALLPLDAFGLTGRYDRAKLTRLYGAVRATVARGPVGRDGRPAESWTLVSPYPDLEFARLQPGTLLIVLDATAR